MMYESLGKHETNLLNLGMIKEGNTLHLSTFLNKD
jgi:hypothetical protein